MQSLQGINLKTCNLIYTQHSNKVKCKTRNIYCALSIYLYWAFKSNVVKYLKEATVLTSLNVSLLFSKWNLFNNKQHWSFFSHQTLGKEKGKERMCGQVWCPILGICALHLTHPSARAHTHTHTRAHARTHARTHAHTHTHSSE